MVRSWRLQTLTGVAQPVFGDLTTAAIVAGPPPNGDVQVTVADTSLYLLGDRIIVAPGQATQNILLVDSFVPGSTTKMMCKSEGDLPVSAYPIGTQIALSMPAMNILIQAAYGSVNPIWVGADKTITSAGAGSAVFQVTPNIPYESSRGASHNVVRTSDLWFAAVAATQGIASANIL